MALIRIIKDWPTPDLLRQTPGGKGEWGGHTFTLDAVEQCDYTIILNRVADATTVTCPPENIWLIVQEPPAHFYRWLRKGFGQPARIYTPDDDLKGAKYLHLHGALPWAVNKTYNELKAQGPTEKTGNLSWITSNSSTLPGHQLRMRFLESLKREVAFDLWGRGFNPIADKWDGLAPYRYALAIENHQCHHYWTEKISDCFLSWTMPIYHGALDIGQYFPEESFVRIDLNDPFAPQKIREISESDLWIKNRDAIEHARNLVLNRHQFFPFVTEQIREAELHRTTPPAPQQVHLQGLPDFREYYHNTSLPRRIWNSLKRRITS